jgi:glycosyltransferase involved in cell wall biosynthesis
MARLAMQPPLDNLPCVVDMVDVDSAKWRALGLIARQPMSWIYSREARCLSAFEKTVVERARSTVVVNQSERGELERLCTDRVRVHVVQNGIDARRFTAPEEPSAQPNVVFCGVMNYAPNQAAAERLGRRVWPLVKQRRPDAKLLLVGASPNRRVLELQRDPSIEVTGTVPDVRPFLWKSAVAAAPLETARGIQNKVLEALAAGLPVVVSPAVFSGLPDDVKAGCIECSSDEQIAASIVDLLDASPAERRRRADRAQLASLNWSRQLQPLLQILRDAVSEDGAISRPRLDDERWRLGRRHVAT